MILCIWIALIILVLAAIIPIGILFIWSLFVILYCLAIALRPKKHLTNAGVIYLIAGIFTAITLGLQLFCNYNILNVILK